MNLVWLLPSGCLRSFNSFNRGPYFPIIWKPFQWFALEINELVSTWYVFPFHLAQFANTEFLLMKTHRVLTILTGKNSVLLNLSTRIYWNRSLAASDIYQVLCIPLSYIKENRCVDKVIHQIGRKLTVALFRNF